MQCIHFIKKETDCENIEQNNIVYLINKKDKTASVTVSPKATGDIFIPKSINYESEEYIVISILQYAFTSSKHVKSIQFPSDSKVRTIEKKAFFNTLIKSIEIPSSLIELEEGWCGMTILLNNVKISPNNPRYCYVDGKYIIGKSSIESDEYDELIFCARNIKDLKIPNFIQCIKSCALDYCARLNTVFLDDSKLKTIENDAFRYSSIEVLSFPSNLIDLKEDWCNGTSYLKRVSVSPENPRYSSYDYDQLIIGKSSIEKDEYDTLFFCSRDKRGEVEIPSFIKHIASNAFNFCDKLSKVEIKSDSKLQSIGPFSFSNSSISSIKIPPHLQKIAKGAFMDCSDFSHIEIPMDSELQTIEGLAFSGDPIVEFTIPSKLIDLQDGWCECTDCLSMIHVSPDNPRYSAYDGNKIIIGKSSIENKDFDVLVFGIRTIETLIIPSFIKHIGHSAFEKCSLLHHIEIPPDSKLKTIGNNAFEETRIEKFSFPSQVTTIGENAFSAEYTKYFIFPENSQLRIIGENAFQSSLITSFVIPQLVSKIGKDAFSFCQKLQILQIEENSVLEFIDIKIFENCENVLVMIPVKLSNNLN